MARPPTLAEAPAVAPPEEMFLSDFLVTLPGRYLVESLWHSLTAVLVVEGALRAWGFCQPVVQQRFRTLVILLPVVAFPAYQLLDPTRGTMSSRLHGLLNTDPLRPSLARFFPAADYHRPLLVGWT